ncbi:MAG TPA: 16S rRNA (guanine(527)-N(7))-methyltransferase RsmG [Spirochaetales bacterium]|nr:16S rRNA (guanine(527)-N(7))-methyltransferase RsmG [Spirochaetales bacterium]
MNETLLTRGLAELGLADDRTASLLGRYVASIEAWNPAYGLVGASGDELVIKHILDSLAPLAIVRRSLAEAATGTAGYGERASLVDLGTGAGLPGVPLAIAMPEVDVTLLDRMTRRIRFLEAVRAELALENVDIVEEQVERAKGSYDVVTFRAFRPFERKLFKRVFSVCSPGGRVVAYKGKADRACAELEAIDGLYESAEITPVVVPFLADERCVVVMRPKASPTASPRKP